MMPRPTAIWEETPSFNRVKPTEAIEQFRGKPSASRLTTRDGNFNPGRATLDCVTAI